MEPTSNGWSMSFGGPRPNEPRKKAPKREKSAKNGRRAPALAAAPVEAAALVASAAPIEAAATAANAVPIEVGSPVVNAAPVAPSAPTAEKAAPRRRATTRAKSSAPRRSSPRRQIPEAHPDFSPRELAPMLEAASPIAASAPIEAHAPALEASAPVRAARRWFAPRQKSAPAEAIATPTRSPHEVRRTHRGDRGAVVVWSALFLVSMLGFAALGVDVTKLTGAKAQVQSAADAVALAAASAIDPVTGRIDRDLAVRRAQAEAEESRGDAKARLPLLLDARDVELVGDNGLRVKVRRPSGNSMMTELASALGIKGLEVTACATAKVDAASAISAVLPVGLMPSPPSAPLEVGSRYTFRLGAESGNAYRPVMLPPCYEGPAAAADPGSAETFESLVRNSYRCTVSLDESVFLERDYWTPGLSRAIASRFAADTDHREGIRYERYHGNGSRVVFLPITTPEMPGEASVRVTGFGAFFIQSRLGDGPGALLVGEFVHAVAEGSGGGSIARGAVAYAAHLVR